MDPIRDPAAERPITRLRATVGNNSPVYIKISPNAADTPNFPIIANTISNQLYAGIHRKDNS
jgi:hypothetical protein